MAAPANTVSSFVAIGNREDLIDAIYNVDPYDTPGLTNFPKVRATGIEHDWQTDTLAAAAGDNHHVEGDDADFSQASRPVTVRLRNISQISRKIVSVTGTQEEVLKAGRRSELAKELLKMGRELRRDMETTLFQNQDKETGDATTARELGSILSYMGTNTSSGTGGADPSTLDGDNLRTDAAPGNRRPFTEALLKTVISSCWVAGGNPNWIMTGAVNKQRLSEFSGVATKFQNVEDKTIIAGADIYVSDFGRLVAMPDRFMRTHDVLVLQRDLWAVAFLRNMRLLELNRTGDAEKRMLVVEYTLEARNEKASGGIFDLTDT